MTMEKLLFICMLAVWLQSCICCQESQPKQLFRPFPCKNDLSPELTVTAQKLILQLASSSFKERRSAREGVEKLGPVVIPLLEEALVNEEPEVRFQAVDLLRPLYNQLNVRLEHLELALIAVGPGRFTMGSPISEKGRSKWERPQCNALIGKPFWIGETEVTQKQYQAILGVNPSDAKGADLPVTDISWNDAVAFCEALTTHERKAGRLPKNLVYRLPTEAEWEYCCRAGSTTAFCFGNNAEELSDYAWYGLPGSAAKSVRRKRPNAWGLYDMHGNVMEACWGALQKSYTGPIAPQSNAGRVWRGGTCNSKAAHCRSAARYPSRADESSMQYGFRLVVGHNHEGKREDR